MDNLVRYLSLFFDLKFASLLIFQSIFLLFLFCSYRDGFQFPEYFKILCRDVG